jgi:hypothetical protein
MTPTVWLTCACVLASARIPGSIDGKIEWVTIGQGPAVLTAQEMAKAAALGDRESPEFQAARLDSEWRGPDAMPATSAKPPSFGTNVPAPAGHMNLSLLRELKRRAAAAKADFAPEGK